MTDPGGLRQRTGYVVAWVVAATLAITLGVFAVTSVGDRIRDRGPIGDNQLVREALQQTGTPSPDQSEPLVEATFSDDFGEFDVACRGKYALGIAVRPDREAGWRTISFEEGPDDDVDAVFSDGSRSQELEVYCDLGRPQLELEDNVLPDED